MKTRILKKGNRFYPQYYSESKVLYWYLKRWKFYEEVDEPCYLTGSGGTAMDVSFSNLDEAKEFIKDDAEKHTEKVVWQSDDEVQKRPIIYEDVKICTTCNIDKGSPVFNIGDDYFRECTRCGHQVNVY